MRRLMGIISHRGIRGIEWDWRELSSGRKQGGNLIYSRGMSQGIHLDENEGLSTGNLSFSLQSFTHSVLVIIPSEATCGILPRTFSQPHSLVHIVLKHSCDLLNSSPDLEIHTINDVVIESTGTPTLRICCLLCYLLHCSEKRCFFGCFH